MPLVVNSPPSIAGTYTDTARLSFAPVNATVTAEVVYIGRGCPAGSISPGSPADPYLANPSGKILVSRGAAVLAIGQTFRDSYVPGVESTRRLIVACRNT